MWACYAIGPARLFCFDFYLFIYINEAIQLCLRLKKRALFKLV